MPRRDDPTDDYQGPGWPRISWCADPVVIECDYPGCGRRGVYGKAGLIERHGGIKLVDLAYRVSEDCVNRRTLGVMRCGAKVVSGWVRPG